MVIRRISAVCFSVLAAIACAPICSAGPVLDPSAPATLSLINLGTISGVNAHYAGDYSYQGMAISGENLLLAVGDPLTSTQIVWDLPLIRTSGHITGFGSPTEYAQVVSADQSSLGNIMAGGLLVTPQGLVYTTQSYTFLGQYTTSTTSSSLLDLTSTGAFAGGLQNLPGGGANQFKVSSVTGQWYTVNTNGGFGSYTLGSFTQYNPGIGAFSFIYVPTDPAFAHDSVVVADAGTQRIDAYGIDANGNPCNPAQNAACSAVVHLVVDNSQSIGYGMVRDPRTGDILFNTQGNQIFALDQSLPEPSTIAMGVSGLALLALYRRRKLTSPRR